MTDVLYVLLTLASFAGLTLLVGLLDRTVVDPDRAGRPGRDR